VQPGGIESPNSTKKRKAREKKETSRKGAAKNDPMHPDNFANTAIEWRLMRSTEYGDATDFLCKTYFSKDVQDKLSNKQHTDKMVWTDIAVIMQQVV